MDRVQHTRVFQDVHDMPERKHIIDANGMFPGVEGNVVVIDLRGRRRVRSYCWIRMG